MDKSLRRYTIGAVVAAIIFICAVWWAGNDNGVERVCNALSAQNLPYCSGNHVAHLLWLLVAVGCGVYLGFYVGRVRKALRASQPTESRHPKNPSGSTGFLICGLGFNSLTGNLPLLLRPTCRPSV
jgi:drug/metabolite transporter (DMT)-like permease